MSTQGKATETTRRRYNRIAPFYDFMEGLAETRYSKWRHLLWSKVEGTHILEVGVGTGKNFPYYPEDAEVTAIDFSGQMLKRAQDKAFKTRVGVRLLQMDAQHLGFEDNAFDTVVASFVICSVPDPVRGLAEVERVLRPGGKVVLLEHVLSANRIVGCLMNWANPLVVRVMGASINRRTVDNVIKSGLMLKQVTDLGFGIFKLIEARKKMPPP